MDHQGNEFLRKLIGSVIVRAVGDQHGQREGMAPGAHEMIGRRLGRRVGAVRPVPIRLGKSRFVLTERAEHLVGRDVQKSKSGFVRRTEVFVKRAGRFQQPECPHDIGRDEIGGAVDRAIDVRLRGKVDDRPRPVSIQQARDKLGIADVAAHENVAGVIGDACEIVEIAGVREFVETDDRAASKAEPVENEIRADKTGRARHQDRLFEGAHLRSF